MSYLLLFFILILLVLYLRLSRRVAGIQLELSEELKSEMITLIAEFNHSAEKNITLIEARVEEAKSISREIADQLSYMKKLKENLEKEIRETEARLHVMVSNQKAALEDVQKKQEEGKSIIARTYALIQEQTRPLKELQKPSEPEEKLSPVENQNSETPLTPQSRRDQVQELWSKGMNAGEIALKTGMTRGEAELILKLLKKSS